jgi:hypothetical protein
MRARALLLAVTLVAGAYAAEELKPLSLEFLEFLELLGEDNEQAEMAEFLIAAEGEPDSGVPEAGAENDE